MYIRLSKNTFPLAILIIAIIASYLYFSIAKKHYQSIVSYSDCVNAGYSVSRTYPETCSIPGKFFVNQKQLVSLPITISTTTVPVPYNDFDSITYTMDGQNILLHMGEGVIPLSVSKGTTTIHIAGKELFFDINGDSLPDTTFLLVSGNQNSTSTVIYYLTSALGLTKGHVGLNILTIGEARTTPLLLYKNASINLTYIDMHANKKDRYFVLEDNLLKELRK